MKKLPAKIEEIMSDGEIPVRPSWKVAMRPLITTPLNKVKVVMLGREASIVVSDHPDGYALSDGGSIGDSKLVPLHTKMILGALHEDPLTKNIRPKHGSLRAWASEGVLLWNTLPMAKVGQPARFVGWGFETLTQQILELIMEERPKTIFVMPIDMPLMYKTIINNKKGHMMLIPRMPYYSAEPVAKSFLDNHMFSKINKYLASVGEGPIDWRIK